MDRQFVRRTVGAGSLDGQLSLCLITGLFLVGCTSESGPPCTNAQCRDALGANAYCDPAVGTCRCTPDDCAGRCSGPDGCGGACQALCPTGATCGPLHRCVTCEPDCAGKECGPDGCGGECGRCFFYQNCNASGTCALKPAGNQGLSEPCTFEAVNAGAGNCQAGLYCLGMLGNLEDSPCPGGDEECLQLTLGEWNPDCVAGACGFSFCATRCTDSTCGEHFDAVMSSDGECFCAPRDACTICGPGEPCAFMDVNPGAGGCLAGMECLGLNADPVNRPCANDADCGTYFPENWNHDCQGGGCGVSFCAELCSQGACDPGFGPFETGGECFCLPAASDTPRSDGEPCSFGEVNMLAGLCVEGLTCIGLRDDANYAPCPGGDSDCLAYYDARWNPDCVRGGCGASFCASPCVAGRCEDCFDTTTTSSGCYCLPADGPGVMAPGNPCPFGLVNAEACFGSCQASLTCIGENADPVARPCATDVDCLAFFPESWNIDCEEGGCGISFCADACIAGACQTGFEPFDVAGTCYCRPGQ